MGGHGALIMALKNQNTSASAFAPIVNSNAGAKGAKSLTNHCEDVEKMAGMG